MKRVITLLLLLALCVGCLPSCSRNFSAATTLGKAEKELTRNTYVVNTDIRYTCEDPVVSAVLNAYVMNVPAVVHGDSILIDMSAETMGTATGVTLTVVDDVLYSHNTTTGTPVLLKTSLKGGNMARFLRDSKVSMPVGVKEFDTMTLATANGKEIVTCTELTAEGAALMVEVIAAPLRLLAASATVRELTMIATIAYSKYETISLNATYLVTVGGKTHEVGLTMNAHYSYEDVSSIKAPADPDTYTWVPYDTLMGK